MSEIQKQWYVIRAIGGKEQKVKEYIEAEVRQEHLEDYVSQVLIPTEKVFTIRNGRRFEGTGVLSGICSGRGRPCGTNTDHASQYPHVLGFLGDSKRRAPE